MKRPAIFRGLALVFLFSLPFLGGAQEPNNTGNASDASGPVLDASRRINDFSIALLRHLGSASADSNNTVVSPQSIYQSLAMCYVAAGGRTRRQLATAFHFPSDNNALIDELAALRQQLHDDTKVNSGMLEFTDLSSLWLDSTNATFRKSYADLVRRKIGTSLHSIHFGDRSAAAHQINQWVSQQTHGLIANLTNPLDFQSKSRPGIIDESALTAVNAVYFNADWSCRFEKGATRPRPFHTNGNTTQQASMMHQYGMHAYAENADVKFLELPYVGKAYCMYVILPKQNIAVAKILKRISSDTIRKLHRLAMGRNVDVLLPKFEASTSLDAKQALKAMGVTDGFDEQAADFDAMICKTAEAYRIYLSSVKQKAIIKVHEQGTQAAAATAATGSSFGCAAPVARPRVLFHADHPFIYLIVDRRSGTILFAGWYGKPG